MKGLIRRIRVPGGALVGSKRVQRLRDRYPAVRIIWSFSWQLVSMGDYNFTVSRDSTIPEGRALALKQMAEILRIFPTACPIEPTAFSMT